MWWYVPIRLGVEVLDGTYRHVALQETRITTNINAHYDYLALNIYKN